MSSALGEDTELGVRAGDLADGINEGSSPHGAVLQLGDGAHVGVALDHGVLKTGVDEVGLVGTGDDAGGDVLLPAGDVGEVLEEPLLGPLVVAPLKTTHAHVRQVLDPLEVGDGHTTSIAENVGDDDDAPLLEHLVGGGGDGAVGSLGDDLGLDAEGVGGVDLVLEGGGHEDVALLLEQGLGVLDDLGAGNERKGFFSPMWFQRAVMSIPSLL